MVLCLGLHVLLVAVLQLHAQRGQQLLVVDLDDFTVFHQLPNRLYQSAQLLHFTILSDPE